MNKLITPEEFLKSLIAICEEHTKDLDEDGKKKVLLAMCGHFAGQPFGERS